MGDREISIRVNIKTPIWTGDIDAKSYTIQTTGMVGSLRWWTETLIRALGKFACDPTGDSRCPKEEKTDKVQKKEKYCPACLIFGATGRRRIFRLDITGGMKVPFDVPINIRPSSRTHGWYFGPGVIGTLNMKIIPLDENFDENLILFPLLIASKLGAIGAKTQHGYGVVELEDLPKNLSLNNFKTALEKLSEVSIKRDESNNPVFPSLKDMFFAKVQFSSKDDDWWQEVDGLKNNRQNEEKIRNRQNEEKIRKCLQHGFVPIGPVIRNWLRYSKEGKKIWGGNDTKLEEWLFGTAKKQATKINISCAYKVGQDLWEVRIWGWLPEKRPDSFDRISFLSTLKNALERDDSGFRSLFGTKLEKSQLVTWILKANTSIEQFIDDMLRGAEK
ncbi:type III-B CRISPR module RAMP protein Cmr1 [Pseudothermotoga sp. U03pept]|uniref:type III-B CRISPR module RAMP protein Cmr1 n=1 Tax=Pseudothermotoga sp. U03pept TaxID=3447012 RepID=UPI003F07FFB9